MSHDVSFAIPSRDLGRADVRFEVRADDGKIGTLTVSKGSVVWFPKDHLYGYKLSWAEVGRLFLDSGVKSEKR